MRLLLDTHIVLWALERSDRLSRRGWALLEDERNALIVSAASVWEVAIKYARNRGRADDLAMSGAEILADIRAANFELLPITPDHAAAVDDLPLHHRDAFDRLLIAQARCEGLHMLTHDAALAAYGDRVIVV